MSGVEQDPLHADRRDNPLTEVATWAAFALLVVYGAVAYMAESDQYNDSTQTQSAEIQSDVNQCLDSDSNCAESSSNVATTSQ